MSVYVVAQININDREAYVRYQNRFMDVFTNFKGTLLAADEAPKIIEGEWAYQKIILISFPDEKSFYEWSQSEAYTEIAEDRKAGTIGTVVLVRGSSQPTL